MYRFYLTSSFDSLCPQMIISSWYLKSFIDNIQSTRVNIYIHTHLYQCPILYITDGRCAVVIMVSSVLVTKVGRL